jgi:hypothetical protein
MLGERNGTTETLLEARDAVRALEGSALAQVAESLSGVAGELLQASERLEKSRPAEWMDHIECAEYLRTTPDALYKLPVPHHKLGGKRLYSRAEVDAAVRGL